MLKAYITALDGHVLYGIREHQGIEVVIPISDSRTAKCTISIYEPAAQYVRPLANLLKIYWHEYLVFWGVILTPVWNATRGGEGTVEINAHDLSLAWKKNFCRYGDRIVDEGAPFDGRAIRRISECAIPSDAARAVGAKHPMIYFSTDTSRRWEYAADAKSIIPDLSGTAPRPANMWHPAPFDRVWTKVQRGTNCFEAIQHISSAIIGPEWKLVPTDDFDGNDYHSFAVCKLHTADYFGDDRTEQFAFYYGGQHANLDSFQHTPDGDKVKNYAVQVWPGGETNRKDAAHKGIAANNDSIHAYGVYEDWQAAPNKEANSVLEARAQSIVDLYGEPPDYFTIQPVEVATGFQENVALYGRDYFEGDYINAVCKAGYMDVNTNGRIMKVTLKTDGGGRSTTELECVPGDPPSVWSALSGIDYGDSIGQTTTYG
jgi:hypothetical protein